MQGGINLKAFILGVKQELVEASEEGRKDPRFELAEMELEAEFSLEASAEAEGGFRFLVKVAGEAKGAQTHKVRLLFRPLSGDHGPDKEADFPFFISTVTPGGPLTLDKITIPEPGKEPVIPGKPTRTPRWAVFKEVIGPDDAGDFPGSASSSIKIPPGGGDDKGGA